MLTRRSTDLAFQTLAMPVRRSNNVSSEVAALAAFATSTGAPPSTATGSPAAATCSSAATAAIDAVQDACGGVSILDVNKADNPALLNTAECKTASAGAVTAIVNTCGHALGLNLSGKSAAALTAADFPGNEAAFAQGRSEAAENAPTLCVSVSHVSSAHFVFRSHRLVT
jgi:hypothetical protein